MTASTIRYWKNKKHVSEQSPMVNGVMVDADAILRTAHRCRPEKCKTAKCCCSAYEIEITDRELQIIVGCLPIVARYVEALKSSDGFENVFEDEENGLYSLDKNERGFCIFTYFDQGGCPWCSLHSAALDMGLRPAEVKPRCCSLWPLSYVDSNPPLLSLHEDALSFACNRRLPPENTDLDQGLADLMLPVFGLGFVQILKDQLRNWSRS